MNDEQKNKYSHQLLFSLFQNQFRSCTAKIYKFCFPPYRYGLLGASGCGKTTLLSCIVGRKKFDAGYIWVLGGVPGSEDSGVPGHRVGYMPQVTP